MAEKSCGSEPKATATNAQIASGLPHKTFELIEVALNAACTSLHSDETCNSIRAALKAGATREEILVVLKMTSLMSIEGQNLRAAILNRCGWSNGPGTASGH